MLGQRVDAGRFAAGVGPVPVDAESAAAAAQGADESVDGSVDCESTLEPPNSPAAPGVSARSRPRLPAPHVCHRDRMRVVGLVALLKGCGGAGPHPREASSCTPAKD